MEKSEQSRENLTIAEYLTQVEKIYKTGTATEHSYRGALEQLLLSLLAGYSVINEPKRRDCGAPDYIITRKQLPVAFIEAKDIDDTDLDGKKISGHKEQFDRYKASLPAIVFTDYLDFHLYLNGSLTDSVRIGEVVDGKVSQIKDNFGKFLFLLDSLVNAERIKIGSATQLARLMAGKARLLQDTTRRFLQLNEPVGRDVPIVPQTTLGKLMSDFKHTLMPDVGIDEFSDIYAQTVTYGMFAARLHDQTPDDFSRFEAAALIPQSNPFLKNLFAQLSSSLEPELAWVVDDIADLFAVASVSKIMKDYGKNACDSDPMIHFYEDFLAAYDAGLRKDRGVWYTPLPVVKFIVGAVDEILKTRFNLTDGLADYSKTEITVEDYTFSGKRMTEKKKELVHRVQVLDPATGTGTFLAECINRIHANFANNEGLWPGYVEEHLLPRLNGFELLMASYTMAHVKLDLILAATGYEHKSSQRFKVFLTDSLTEGKLKSAGLLFSLALGEETEQANKVKRDAPVMVVLGNPPYNGESSNKSDFIMKLMEAYKKEPGGQEKLKEKNPKWLNDDYVKFMRLAESYIEKNGSGVVAFINPHGFLDNPTFRGMRWRLMQTYDEIYVLNLHGNAKKKEVAPDGGKDENVFDIMQGVSINIFVKRGGLRPHTSATIHYADVWGKRKDKFAFLDSHTLDTVEWQTLVPTTPMYFFVPKDTKGEEEYNRGFKIDELCTMNSVGIVTAKDKTFVAHSKTELRDQIRSDIDSFDEQYVRNYAYRPFDMRYLYYDAERLERPREKLVKQFRDYNITLIANKHTKYHELTRYFVTDAMSDLHLLDTMNASAYVFPLYLYNDNIDTVNKTPNLNPEIVAKIAAAVAGRSCSAPTEDGTEPVPPIDIFDYIYAVLHTPEYRSHYKEFLKVDFPRIPYPKDTATFRKLVEIGTALRKCHLMQDAPPTLSESAATFPIKGDNVVDVVRFEFLTQNGRVYINATQYFDNVCEADFNFFIGGYQPAQKWLKDRKNRTLTLDDLKHYQRIIVALRRTRELMARLSDFSSEWLDRNDDLQDH